VEAVRISETSVHFNESIYRCIPENSSKLHTRRRENLKPNKSRVIIIPQKCEFFIN
jgi:hypothetical protein